MPDGDVASQNATTARSESSAEYVIRQIARHRRALAVAAAALALMTAGAWWAISRRSSPGHDTPSVVVLPFVTIGSGDGYFADGITEAVTTELGKVAGLRVIASNTAFGTATERRSATSRASWAWASSFGVRFSARVVRCGLT